MIYTKDLMPPYLFAASYLGQARSRCAGIIVLVFFRVAAHARTSPVRKPAGRSARSPASRVHRRRGLRHRELRADEPDDDLGAARHVRLRPSVADATLGIQWHVLAMYAPSFFTGSLILRFGVARDRGLGLVLLALSAVVGFSGMTVAHFWIALVLLGIGWNFAFVGATTMVTESHRPEERNKVQAFNDF